MTTQTFTHPTLVINAHNLPHDHVGDDVAPLTDSGTPYRYALIDDHRHQITWATDAEGILAHLIDTYPLDEPDDPTQHHQIHHERLIARSRYIWAALVNHAAAAITAGADPGVCQTLQRAVEPDNLPTFAEIPAWTHDIPLALPAQFYAPYNPGRTAPLGNTVLLDADSPELLLDSLARLGTIHLLTHTSLDAPGHLSLATGDPLTTLQNDLDELIAALFVLEDDDLDRTDPTSAEAHVEDLRLSLSRTTASARAYGAADADLPDQHQIDHCGRAELIASADALAETLAGLTSGTTDA